MTLTYDQAYARHKQVERDMGRRVANDVDGNERSRRAMDRFSAACKQTRGNLKAANLLILQWEEAEERARNSPVRTLVLSEDGDPEAFTQEDDQS